MLLGAQKPRRSNGFPGTRARRDCATKGQGRKLRGRKQHIMDTTRKFTEADLYEQIAVTRDRGRYKSRVRIGYDEGSKRYIYHTIYGADEVEVRAGVFDYIRAQIDGQAAQRETDALLTTDMESWLYAEKRGSIKAGSFDRLEQIYRHQIAPHVAGLQTAATTARDCKKIMDANLAAGYSYSTLLKTYRLLHEYFEVRRQQGDLVRNPMDTIRMYSRDYVLQQQAQLREARSDARAKQEAGKPITDAERVLADSRLRMADREEIRVLTDAEIARIRDVAYNGYVLEFTSRGGKPVRSGPYYLKQAKFFIFAMNVGLRKGELMALKYSDVDFDKKCITINRNRTVSRKRDADGRATGGSVTIEGTPKTKRSASTIPASDAAIQILREMLAEEPEGYDGYIANDNGKPLVESAFRRRFDSLLRHAHVEHCGLHSLRHTFASRLFAATGNAKIVSEMVRHSSTSFTEDIYIHLLQETKNSIISEFKI